MPFNEVKIQKITYSLPLTKTQMDLIMEYDIKSVVEGNSSLTCKLMCIKDVKYVDYSINDLNLKVCVVTDSVTKYAPSRNPEFWQHICQVIAKHITQKEQRQW